MKKLFLAIIALASVAVFANTNTGGGKKKKSTSPPKGTVVINAKDSTVTYRKSDSVLAATMIPAGFKTIEKPR